MSGNGELESENGSIKLGQRLASQLRDEIIAGQWEPGAALRLMPLAKRLGVSTTPIREALTILERQGLASSHLHRGFRVAEITPSDIADVYAVHAYMSQLLAERATRRLTEEDIEQLEALDHAMQVATEEGNAVLAADLNHELHRRINQKAGAPLLARMLRETTPFVVRRQDPNVPGWAQHRLVGHGVVLAAMRERDGSAAGELMAEHIRRSGELASDFAKVRAADRGAATPGTAPRTTPGRVGS